MAKNLPKIKRPKRGDLVFWANSRKSKSDLLILGAIGGLSGEAIVAVTLLARFLKNLGRKQEQLNLDIHRPKSKYTPAPNQQEINNGAQPVPEELSAETNVEPSTIKKDDLRPPTPPVEIENIPHTKQPKEEKKEAADESIEYRGHKIQRIEEQGFNFKVNGEPWDTLKNAKEYIDVLIASGGSIKHSQRYKPEEEKQTSKESTGVTSEETTNEPQYTENGSEVERILHSHTTILKNIDGNIFSMTQLLGKIANPSEIEKDNSLEESRQGEFSPYNIGSSREEKSGKGGSGGPSIKSGGPSIVKDVVESTLAGLGFKLGENVLKWGGGLALKLFKALLPDISGAELAEVAEIAGGVALEALPFLIVGLAAWWAWDQFGKEKPITPAERNAQTAADVVHKASNEDADKRKTRLRNAIHKRIVNKDTNFEDLTKKGFSEKEINEAKKGAEEDIKNGVEEYKPPIPEISQAQHRALNETSNRPDVIIPETERIQSLPEAEVPAIDIASQAIPASLPSQLGQYQNQVTSISTEAPISANVEKAPKSENKQTVWPKEKLKNLIKTIAHKYNIPPELALSIAEHESHWNPNVHQSKLNKKDKNGKQTTDWGLMQVNDSVWETYKSPATGTARLDPVTNVNMGIRLLSDIYHSKDANRDIKKTLIGYARGQGTLQQYNKGTLKPETTKQYESLANEFIEGKLDKNGNVQNLGMNNLKNDPILMQPDLSGAEVSSLQQTQPVPNASTSGITTTKASLELSKQKPIVVPITVPTPVASNSGGGGGGTTVIASSGPRNDEDTFARVNNSSWRQT